MMRAKSYDYIIVGAGSAGCVIANRLSADAECSVLLIEAGGADRNPLFSVPMLMGRLFKSKIYNWSYHTAPVPSLCNRSIYWPRGKVLGGSSTINGMVYVRGNQHDYDSWEQMGLKGWSYENVLPAFRHSEGHIERSDAYHGNSGELTVCRARGKNVLFDVFVEAGCQAGYPANDDFNGRNQIGFGRYDFNIRNGRRCSTSVAFLRKIRNRSNLTVATNCLVHKVSIARGCATGVEVAKGSQQHSIRARREVILCAGTVNSPQLLMLSGIGPAAELSKHGISIVHDLPGVGRNLQDHVDCVMDYICTKPITLRNSYRVDRLMGSIATGLLFGKGVFTTFPYEAGAFINSEDNKLPANIQIHFMPTAENSARPYIPMPFIKSRQDSVHGFSLRVGPVKPVSRGWIELRSADPTDAPVIHPNYLDSEADFQTMIAGIRIVRDVIGQPVFDQYRGPELAPGTDIQNTPDFKTWLRTNAMTTFHPVGTCRMGTDSMAVVDARLQVHGVENLRIADASIMPDIVSGNTNAPTIMIGEKAAEFIRGNHESVN